MLFSSRDRLRRRQRRIGRRVACAHYDGELDALTDAILARRALAGAVAELGCYKGGSTAKLSLACAQAGKRLHVFDSFEGLPEPEPWDAQHRIERERTFTRGEYAGTLEEVRANVARLGRPDVCELHPGWFSETLPGFDEPLAVVFADVDLAASLREACLHLWPSVVPGGILFAHDATDEKLQSVLADESLFPGASERFVPTREALPSLATKTLAWVVKADAFSEGVSAGRG